MPKVINVGVIGLGMMGSTHLDVYNKLEGVKIFAVADLDPAKLSGEEKATGNIEGQAEGGVDLSAVKKYKDGYDLINDPEIDLVDVCVWTHLHKDMAKAVLDAGKHLLLEKPLARTFEEAKEVVEAAKNSKQVSMSAMCIRFWPGWKWLKETIDAKTYGSLLSVNFTRLASHPGGDFYKSGEQCGGALLDLHVHDTDFVNFCFGMPDAVFSRGYSKISGETDHVITQYIYNDDSKPRQVTAEGGWAMSEGYDFRMLYTANFENATVTYSFDGEDQITVFQEGQEEPEKITVESGMGYEHEIRHLVKAIQEGQPADIEAFEQAANSIAIVEAEKESIRTGNAVSLSFKEGSAS